MTLTTPSALLLLVLLIPLIAYVGWPRNRFRRTRDSASLALRVMIMALVVFAVAGVQIVQSADRLAVVFLVDVSTAWGLPLRMRRSNTSVMRWPIWGLMMWPV